MRGSLNQPHTSAQQSAPDAVCPFGFEPAQTNPLRSQIADSFVVISLSTFTDQTFLQEGKPTVRQVLRVCDRQRRGLGFRAPQLPRSKARVRAARTRAGLARCAERWREHRPISPSHRGLCDWRCPSLTAASCKSKCKRLHALAQSVLTFVAAWI